MIMQYYPHEPYHGYGWYGYGWAYAVIVTVIILAIILVILYLVFRRPETQEKSDDKALEILRERYARGGGNKRRVRRDEEKHREAMKEDFSELIKYTIPGYAGGLLLGGVLDYFGFQTNPIGQWAVRTLSGEGDSIFEGIFAIRQRFRGAERSMAEAYSWGKVLGMVFPWIIDAISRMVGIDVYGVGGFYIPYFYAMSDQMGASISGFLYMHREERSWGRALRKYFKHPVMMASLSVIIIVPVALLAARLLGFSPTTQIYVALETIAANLCWVPPLVGWISERRQKI